MAQVILITHMQTQYKKPGSFRQDVNDLLKAGDDNEN